MVEKHGSPHVQPSGRSFSTSMEQDQSGSLQDAIAHLRAESLIIEQGGGAKGIERQHRHGRLTARERIAQLVDSNAAVFESTFAPPPNGRRRPNSRAA